MQGQGRLLRGHSPVKRSDSRLGRAKLGIQYLENPTRPQSERIWFIVVSLKGLDSSEASILHPGLSWMPKYIAVGEHS